MRVQEQLMRELVIQMNRIGIETENLLMEQRKNSRLSSLDGMTQLHSHVSFHKSQRMRMPS